MQVKITKGRKNSWYENKVGEVFEVEPYSNFYKALEKSTKDKIYLIYLDDCEEYVEKRKKSKKYEDEFNFDVEKD